MEGSAVLPFHEFYRKVKGTLPSGELWDVYRTNLAVDSAMLRLIAMPPGSPPLRSMRCAPRSRASTTTRTTPRRR